MPDTGTPAGERPAPLYLRVCTREARRLCHKPVVKGQRTCQPL